MALGKKTGGRKIGSANKRTREIADKAIAEGVTPLEYMLDVMRAPMMPEIKQAIENGQIDADTITRLSGWHKMRYDAAKDAAPYIHPRLQAITGPDGGAIQIEKIERVVVNGSK